MEKRLKEFLISTADVAFHYNGALAFTGTTSLNTSINVTMEDQEITGGQGNKLLYKMKYGRKVALSIEMAEWNLAFLAANSGTAIATALKDVYKVAECVTLTAGVGTLAKTPATGYKVYVEKPDKTIVEVTPVGSTITVGSTDAMVRATYRYNTSVRRITIDSESTPLVGALTLTAARHNNAVGKVGEVQIEVPSFQVSGNFDINLDAGGNTTTKIDGDALSVEGDSCATGSVYAYISEIDDAATTIIVNDIVATPSVIALVVSGVKTKTLTVVGIKGGMYANVAINNTDCTFVSSAPATATVSAAGLITSVAAGTTYVTVTYGTLKDIVQVTVTA